MCTNSSFEFDKHKTRFRKRLGHQIPATPVFEPFESMQKNNDGLGIAIGHKCDVQSKGPAGRAGQYFMKPT
jgi:hypothetical protein